MSITNVCRAAAGLLIAIASLTVGLGSTSAKHHPYHVKRVTLSIQVTRRANSPTSTDLRSWGVITSPEGKCKTFSCAIRVKPHSLVSLREQPASKKKHPFEYWVLPDGSKVTAQKLKLSVPKNEPMKAVYKS